MPYKGKNNIEIRINQLMVAINHLVADIAKNLTAVNSEEATKQSFILPFFKELGYNVHNPREFKPEISSLNLPTNERVDYALFRDDQLLCIIECKHWNTDLNGQKHWQQLFKYNAAFVESKFAVMTNGIEYMFYSDFDQDNVLDKKPFFIFDINSFSQNDLRTLLKFSKNDFSKESYLLLKCQTELNKLIPEKILAPSKEYCKFIFNKMLGRTGMPPFGFTEVLHDCIMNAVAADMLPVVSALNNADASKITAGQAGSTSNEFPYKAGFVVNKAFRHAFVKDLFSAEDMRFLLSQDSAKVFKTGGYAFLRQHTGAKIDIVGQDGRVRYYREPVKFQKKKYYMTHELYKRGLEPILQYLEGHGMSREEVILICEKDSQ